MIILGIETSCDETAISLIEASGTLKSGVKIAVLADKTLSQIELHRQYGGVFPSMAKREHAKNLIPLLKQILMESDFLEFKVKSEKLKVEKNLPTCNLQLTTILEREPELLKQFLEFIPTIQKLPTRPVRSRGGSQRHSASNGIDLIAVTEGPGLEPCLWTGLNFARALSLVWNIPVVPVNHMEGHIFSALLRKDMIHDSRFMTHEPAMPALALLISGGHTELVLIKNWFKYEIIGQTRDDAVGEAFDKVARLLGLPYPGGPEISALAEHARSDFHRSTYNFQLPRPMLHSNNLDFSFSGLKTSVLHLLKKLESEARENYPRESAFSIRDNPRLQQEIAREFEDAVTEVLVSKTKEAIKRYGAKALLIGGGVIANTHIRRAFDDLARMYDRTFMLNEFPIHFPEPNLTTDNALMIAVAGFLRFFLKNGLKEPQDKGITAKGNLRLNEK